MTSEWTSLAAGFGGAIIGGVFSLAGTYLSNRGAMQRLATEQQSRLKWNTRWEIAKEIHARASDLYWALRRLSYPEGKEKSSNEAAVAKDAYERFHEYYERNKFLLDKELSTFADELAKNLINVQSDLLAYTESLYGDGPQAAETNKHLHEFKCNHQKSLVGGEIEQSLEQLGNKLRAFLNVE